MIMKFYLLKNLSNVVVYELESKFAIIAFLFQQCDRSCKNSTDLKIILLIKTEKDINEKIMNYSMKKQK